MEMEQIHLQEEEQQEQQHEHKLQQQHLQQQHLEQQHLQQQHLQQQQQPVEATEQQQQHQLLQKEVWHRKTSVMEIFRSSLGSDDEIIEEVEHLRDFVSSASPSSRFPQTKSQSRSNVWGPVYLNRDTFIDMHIR